MENDHQGVDLKLGDKPSLGFSADGSMHGFVLVKAGKVIRREPDAKSPDVPLEDRKNWQG